LPDLFLPVARGGYHGLYIEIKRSERGKVSPEQKMMIFLLQQQGYCVEVAHGAAEGKHYITEYINATND
jgi:hypothetical protein